MNTKHKEFEELKIRKCIQTERGAYSSTHLATNYRETNFRKLAGFEIEKDRGKPYGNRKKANLEEKIRGRSNLHNMYTVYTHTN